MGERHYFLWASFRYSGSLLRNRWQDDRNPLSYPPERPGDRKLLPGDIPTQPFPHRMEACIPPLIHDLEDRFLPRQGDPPLDGRNEPRIDKMHDMA